jgi:hypothetical protein
MHKKLMMACMAIAAFAVPVVSTAFQLIVGTADKNVLMNPDQLDVTDPFSVKHCNRRGNKTQSTRGGSSRELTRNNSISTRQKVSFA